MDGSSSKTLPCSSCVVPHSTGIWERQLHHSLQHELAKVEQHLACEKRQLQLRETRFEQDMGIYSNQRHQVTAAA